MIDLKKKCNSPGPLIGIMKAASEMDNFFLKTPTNGYDHQLGLERILFILSQEFLALKLGEIFEHLFCSTIKVDVYCDCSCSEIEVTRAIFPLKFNDDQQGESLQKIIDEFPLHENRGCCSDCGEYFKLKNAQIITLAPHIIIYFRSPIQEKLTDATVFELPEEIIIKGETYSYAAIGCSEKYYNDENQMFAHAFGIIFDGFYACTTSDEFFECAYYKYALNHAETFGRTFFLRKTKW